MTAPKPYSEAVFIEASRAPPIAALEPSAKLRDHRLPGKEQDGQDADQQRPFHRPDRGHAWKRSCTTGAALPITAGTKSVALAVEAGDPLW
jgi:hypothetical protein